MEAETPFAIGSELQLRLATASGVFAGTFALRCLHTHRARDKDGQDLHLSALMFVQPPDAIRETLAHLWENPVPPPAVAQAPASAPQALRLITSMP